MYTDASSYRWAGVLNPTAVPLYASDYWPVEILSSDIAVKEALALSNALSSFDATIYRGLTQAGIRETHA